MSEIPSEASAWLPLSPECELYRALLKPSMVSGTHVLPPAFMRRPPHPVTGEERDADGLSVSLAAGRDEPTTIRAEVERFSRCVAVCRIPVREVRDVETTPRLDAIQDAEDHANITGLPKMPADVTTEEGKSAVARAEFLGGELARRATVVWHKGTASSDQHPV